MASYWGWFVVGFATFPRIISVALPAIFSAAQVYPAARRGRKVLPQPRHVTMKKHGSAMLAFQLQ